MSDEHVPPRYSYLTALTCSACGETTDPDAVKGTCPACGLVLDFLECELAAHSGAQPEPGPSQSVATVHCEPGINSLGVTTTRIRPPEGTLIPSSQNRFSALSREQFPSQARQ